ncbi:MAG: hypothetical protein ACNA8N_15615, partial [Trueperaceae bacterium]
MARERNPDWPSIAPAPRRAWAAPTVESGAAPARNRRAPRAGRMTRPWAIFAVWSFAFLLS